MSFQTDGKTTQRNAFQKELMETVRSDAEKAKRLALELQGEHLAAVKHQEWAASNFGFCQL